MSAVLISYPEVDRPLSANIGHNLTGRIAPHYGRCEGFARTLEADIPIGASVNRNG